MNRKTHLDLFSGIGGFALAAKLAGYETVAFCENDEFCQRVLAKQFGAVVADAESLGCVRINDDGKRRGKDQKDGVSQKFGGSGRPVIHGDIRKFDGRQYRGVSLLTGGFPCQPFSQAGKRAGKEDDRHLWPEMVRVIDEARPGYVLGENVPGIISMELDQCLSDLEGIGYPCGTLVIPACAVDAPHRRDRVWILACDSDRDSKSALPEYDTERKAAEHGSGQGPGGEERGGEEQARWLAEPDVGRVAHGIPNRVHRLRALGNAIVLQVAYQILKAIP